MADEKKCLDETQTAEECVELNNTLDTEESECAQSTEGVCGEQALSAEDSVKSEKTDADDDLEKELLELTELFKAELKKAKEAEEAQGEDGEFELIQELDDTPVESSEAEIPEEELCLCCGERPRDKTVSQNYEYCAECRENMKRYPIGIHHFASAAAVIVCAVIAIMTFTVDFEGYSLAFSASKNAKSGKLTTAVSDYENSIGIFEDGKIGCKFLKLKNAESIYKTLPSGAKSLSEAASYIDEALSPFEAKLPVYKKYVRLRNNALNQYAVLEEFYAVMGKEQYAGFDGTNGEMYSAMQAELEALVGKNVEITDIDGDKLEMPYDEGMIRFSQYMLAYSCKKDDDSYKYITLMKEASPESICLYGYELSLGEIKRGKLSEAELLTDAMLENNAEDVNAYIIKSCLKRLGGDFDGALSVAAEGLEIDEANADLYRQRSMALILKGDPSGALEEAKAGLNYSQYGALYYVYLVAANEKGDAQEVSAAKEQIASMGIGYTERMSAYLNGEISAAQLFSEGTGDVE